MKRVEDILELKRIANRMRRNIVNMIAEPVGPVPQGGTGRLEKKARLPAPRMNAGGSLSATEIVAALFFNLMRHDPTRPAWPDRDRLILSRGHAIPMLCCAYAEAGYLDEASLRMLGKLESPLQAAVDRRALPILEAWTGSASNGLSLGLGTALAGRMERRAYRVYVVLEGEECGDRQMWESAVVAAHHRADNLCTIVDHSRPRREDPAVRARGLEPLLANWRTFGWNTLVIDGHDFPQLLEALGKARETTGRATAIVANTVKGKGVSFLENNLESLNPEQVRQAVEELEKEAASLA